MHRHSYQGRKLSLKTDQRSALLRGLVTSLVLHEQIETTLPRAKELAPAAERLISRAKRGTLADQRALREFLLTENAVQKLVQELAPAFSGREGGYTRIIKSGNRRGDNAPAAVVALVLPPRLAKAAEAEAKDQPAKQLAKKPAKKAPARPAIASAKPAKKARTAKGSKK